MNKQKKVHGNTKPKEKWVKRITYYETPEVYEYIQKIKSYKRSEWIKNATRNQMLREILKK